MNAARTRNARGAMQLCCTRSQATVVSPEAKLARGAPGSLVGKALAVTVPKEHRCDRY